MKKAIVLLLTCATIVLTGCSSVDSLVEKVMLKQSGILDDVNYQQYKKYSSNGQLDADGYYVEENASTAYDSQQGKIWVTFSENSNLDVKYYTDAKHENLLGKQCYLNPGDSIYAVVTVKNSNSMYEFSSFRIYEYDADGKKAQTEVLNFKEQHEDYILTLPKDYSETSISILPVGKYNSKAISLNDYYTDENNNVQNPHGTWSVNGQECTSGSVEISPLSSYIVSYKYDSDEYFLLSSEPEVYYSDDTTGEIIFQQCDADNETAEYSVELCKKVENEVELTVWTEKSIGDYISFSLIASQYEQNYPNYDKSLIDGNFVNNIYQKGVSTVSDKEYIFDKKLDGEKPITISSLKGEIPEGDAVCITITYVGSKKDSSTETRYITNVTDEIGPIYLHYFDTNTKTSKWCSSIEISIELVAAENLALAKAADNSSITVRNADTNEVLTGSSLIEDSQKVVVTISPDQGYYISGKKVSNGVYVDTMKYSEFKKEIDNIIEKHPISKYCVISLDASDKYATYVYKLDGEIVSGKINAKEGQKLELTYEITDSSYQLAQASGGLPIVGWGASDTKANKSIEITSEMDGKTITKADFDIETKKVG